ncbi:MAG: hypothetical protein EXR53_02700 [Dehalococcoidia bacterium]|nr:hypothetical protein [Dehalococcoidia bacterium]
MEQTNGSNNFSHEPIRARPAGLLPSLLLGKAKSRRLPYQSFPCIFSSIDRYVKQMARHHFDSAGVLPAWFPTVGEVDDMETVPNYRSFTAMDPKSSMTLRGEPDEVLRLKGATYHIVDYKTARLTDNAQSMFPRYVAQLNAYAYIGSRHAFSPVSGLSLIYFEPNTDLEGDPSLAARTQEEFLLGFTPKLKAVDVKPDSFIEGLLLLAKAILEQDAPPAGNGGCKECQAVEELMEMTRPPSDA